MKTSEEMVESIYFLKPAWCRTHLAGLWPEQGLHRLRKNSISQKVPKTDRTRMLQERLARVS